MRAGEPVFLAALFLTAGLALGEALGAAFFAGLLLTVGFGLEVFRDTVFWATARLAFGRADFGLAERFLAAAFGVERRAAARDVERLKPLVTALIFKSTSERVNVDANGREVATGE